MHEALEVEKTKLEAKIRAEVEAKMRAELGGGGGRPSSLVRATRLLYEVVSVIRWLIPYTYVKYRNCCSN